MRKLMLIITVILTASFVIAPVAGSQEITSYTKQEHPFELHRFTLDNGFRVWCQPRPDSKSVVAFLVVRAGVRNENKSNNGISHYLEHMLFTGTDRWNEDEIKDMIDKRGGYWNGWTGMESTMYFAELSAQDFEIAMDWLAEIVFHSTFPAEKVDKERNVVFQEKWGKYGWLINTGRRIFVSFGLGYDLWNTVERLVFPNSSLTLNDEWEDEALDRIDRAALLEYYHTYYMPNNAILLIAGNVTPEQAREQALRYFGNLKQGTPPPIPATPEMSAAGPYSATIRGPLPTNQCLLRIGARTVGPTHLDTWALNVLGEMLSTSLFKEIRNKRGLVYGVSADNHTYSDVGRFEIETRSESSKRGIIQQIIAEQLQQIRQGDLDPEKVTDAKVALKGRWALRMERNFGRVLWLNDWVLSLTEDDAVPDYQAQIDAVAPEDLTRVLNTYFVPEHSYVVMHLPILTVYRGAWIGGSVLVLAVGVFYRHRRSKNRRSH